MTDPRPIRQHARPVRAASAAELFPDRPHRRRAAVPSPSTSPGAFINWVDSWVRPFIPRVYRPETYLPFDIPGFGLIIALFALTLLGFLTANLVGRTLVEFGETSSLDRMPIVRPIYKT